MDDLSSRSTCVQDTIQRRVRASPSLICSARHMIDETMVCVRVFCGEACRRAERGLPPLYESLAGLFTRRLVLINPVSGSEVGRIKLYSQAIPLILPMQRLLPYNSCLFSLQFGNLRITHKETERLCINEFARDTNKHAYDDELYHVQYSMVNEQWSKR